MKTIKIDLRLVRNSSYEITFDENVITEKVIENVCQRNSFEKDSFCLDFAKEIACGEIAGNSSNTESRIRYLLGDNLKDKAIGISVVGTDSEDDIDIYDSDTIKENIYF
jgi:hypothetical protein